MLRIAATLARIVFGFVLACLAAGLVTVLFVNTPADVFAQPVSRLPETASETFDLALLTATHASIFAALFVLIVAPLGEWFSIRSLSFYLLAGIAITLLGFAAQYASEITGQPTILNNYALKAFLTTGFIAGFVYWLAAGQFAGDPPDEVAIEAAHVHRGGDGAPPPLRVERREPPPRIDVAALVNRRPRLTSLLNRIKFAPRDTESGSDAQAPAALRRPSQDSDFVDDNDADTPTERRPDHKRTAEDDDV